MVQHNLINIYNMSFYPKNIIQAICLLLIGILSITPLIAFKESGLLEIQDQLFNQLAFSLLFVSICGFYWMKNHKNTSFHEFFDLGSRLSTKTYVMLFLLVIVFIVGVNIPLSKYIIYHLVRDGNLSNPLNNLPLILGATLLAPICEETIFRGMILRGFLQNYSLKTAIALSVVIFMVLHINPSLLFGALFLGLLFSYLFSLTNSIWPGVLFHTLSNLLSLFIGFLLYKKLGVQNIEAVYGDFSLGIVILSSAVCISLVYIILNLNRSK